MDALRTCGRPFVYPGPASERGNAESPYLHRRPHCVLGYSSTALQCRYALLRGRLLPALGLALVKQRVSLLLLALLRAPGIRPETSSLGAPIARHPGCRTKGRAGRQGDSEQLPSCSLAVVSNGLFGVRPREAGSQAVWQSGLPPAGRRKTVPVVVCKPQLGPSGPARTQAHTVGAISISDRKPTGRAFLC